jgi:hypothetical protein
MKKKAKLRAIDRGTRYDITGKMRNLIRTIERGEIKPRDIIILTRESNGSGLQQKTGMYHFGAGDEQVMHWMLSTAKNRIEPA